MLIFSFFSDFTFSLLTVRAVFILPHVSNKFFYSSRCLSTLFLATFKKLLHRYLLERKFEHAKKMLEAGKSMTFTAETLNFSSANNFSRAFKQYFGFSPQA